jgi:hypothetical protein
MANEIIASNKSIIHTQFYINQLYNIANSPAETIVYTTGTTEYLDLTYISNGTINRFMTIESVLDVSDTSVILTLAAGASINVFNSANKMIVPPNYRIIIGGGGAVTNARIIAQGISFYNSP